MTPGRRVARIVAGAAAVLATAAVALPPALYVGMSHAREAGAIDAEAADLAHAVTERIAASPELWRFELMRLRDLLERPAPPPLERRRILSSSGEVIAATGDALPAPVLVRRRPLLDAGEPVAVLEVSRSWRPQALRAALLLVALLPPGALAFVVLSAAPLRALAAQRRLEERLAEARRLEAVGRLAGGVAHDFNNLLAAIKAGASALRFDTAPEDPRQEDLREIVAAVDRAAALTRSLLTFGRRQPVALEEVDLRTVVGGVERTLRAIAGGAVDLVAEPVAPEPLPALADPLQLEQALVQLVANARDATPAGGRIRVGARRAHVAGRDAAALRLRPGPYARITVTDGGAGVTAELRARIFEPFFTTKDPGQGTGLGLAIVHGIVQQHGGGIDVEDAPGGGAAFSILLPLRPASLPSAASAAP